MYLKDCHNHRVFFTYQKKIFMIWNAVEESIHSLILHDHMASRQKTMWSIGQNGKSGQKPRGQSAETTWSIGRNHDVFK